MASSDSDHDQESVCSDGSWIITPAPHFQGLGQSCEVSHPLEDLLIEHPTMSVYHHARTSNTNHKHFQSSPHEQQKTGENVNEETNTNQLQRKMVFKLLQSQPRHRVAMHQDIFLTPPPKVLPSSLPGPRITKKALKRHNANVLRRFRGKQVQKSWSKSGRRRC